MNAKLQVISETAVSPAMASSAAHHNGKYKCRRALGERLPGSISKRLSETSRYLRCSSLPMSLGKLRKSVPAKWSALRFIQFFSNALEGNWNPQLSPPWRNIFEAKSENIPRQHLPCFDLHPKLPSGCFRVGFCTIYIVIMLQEHCSVKIYRSWYYKRLMQTNDYVQLYLKLVLHGRPNNAQDF
ncbi:hypothetical protein Cgig2_001208 [Carnegiea gigantea]|uniref:Uncharacterized protein n=1 Tax=Carnegiea gigantea TaxID=171969 RepID=A0A9Q1JZJ5_9CARY|nr:hypothetical protein Cgig2_001208 [Carnegiea gigantea]